MIKLILVIIGDSGIGKTCLLQRINNDEFTEEHNPTILDSFYRNIDHDGETRRIRLVLFVSGSHDPNGSFDLVSGLGLENNWMTFEGVSTQPAITITTIFAILLHQTEEL